MTRKVTSLLWVVLIRAIIGVGANGWWYLGIDMGLETGVDDGCWEGKEREGEGRKSKS